MSFRHAIFSEIQRARICMHVRCHVFHGKLFLLKCVERSAVLTLKTFQFCVNLENCSLLLQLHCPNSVISDDSCRYRFRSHVRIKIIANYGKNL